VSGDDPIAFPVERDGLFGPPRALREIAASGRPRRLRFPDGHVGWLVGDYANARAVLGDRRFDVGVTRQASGQPGKYEAYDAAIGPLRAGAMTQADPPAHTRLRRAVGERLSPASVNARSGAVAEIVRDQLDALEAAGSPADLCRHFALPIPSRVICDLLGVPADDAQHFVEPTELLLSQHATPDDVVRSFASFTEYVREVVARKRAHPEDDLLSDMLRAEELTDVEIAGLALELFVTGHETTAGLIAMSTLVLLADRARWELLRSEPDLAEGALDELLRYVTVVDIGFTRTAREDLTIGGVEVAAGESVAVSLLAANHDPDAFDATEDVDLRRADSRHLAFGHGIHKCLGQYLARLETRLALSALVERFPDLQLAVAPAEVPLESTDAGVYSVRELPVRW
jgi:cytochrome P450